MVLKAARGAGLPLGHCEDIAAAAVYLAATDPARLTCLDAALAGPFDAVAATVKDNEMRCASARAAMAGPAAIDAVRAGVAQVRLCDLDAPRLVLALFGAHRVAVDHAYDGADLIVTPARRDAPAAPLVGHVTVPSIVWENLRNLADETYVPASDASRIAGAGAGLNDND